MALRVLPRIFKSNPKRTWRLVYVTERGVDKNGKKIREFDYSEQLYATWEFDTTWTIAKAKQRLSQIRAKKSYLQVAGAHTKLKQQNKLKILARSAFLPSILIQEFESFLAERIGIDDQLPPKTASHWLAAQTFIAEVGIGPEEYFENGAKFYNLALRKQISPSYFKKILRLVNLWGFYFCKKEKRPFLPVPRPRGKRREAIADAFYIKSGGGLERAPLNPDTINQIRHTKKLTTEAWNYIFVASCFGLRPGSCDRLVKSEEDKTWRIYKDKHGTTILAIYQTKLQTIDRKDRWKYIPCIFNCQIEALNIIRTGIMKRPRCHTIQRIFGKKYGLYSMRKGFLDWCVAGGDIGQPQKFENCSLWLGHASLDMSLRNYKQRDIAHYDLPITAKISLAKTG